MATNKRFKCPFCDKRLSRKDLVAHIGRVHSDELPEDFTPLRATFHAANRKDFDYRPPCRICKKPTEWDEKKGRYDQICRTKQCHDAYVEKMKVNMGDKLGSNRYTASPEGLEKMLAGRRISGKYKFADGGEKTYTGSYEKKALEFFDKVLHCKSEDVVTPGPVLEYNLDGKRHYYITDIYYVPYDLIIEVKDGGDSPNTNPAFSDTRRKVIAKEKFVIENTNYNYIRLTNNDFSQLLAVFADLKVAFNDSRISGKDPARVVHANEATLVECMIGTIQAAMPMANANDVVVVNYMQNNVFSDKSDIAVADNIKFDRIFKQDKYTGVIEEVDRSFLENCSYSVYRVKDGKHFFDEISNHVGEVQGLDFIYESVFGHKRYTEDQIQYEAEEIQDYYYSLLSIQEEVTDYITEAGVTPAKLEKIKEFNKELNGYDYGVVVKNKPIHDLSSVDTQQYYTISADTFAHHKIGTCWDYVNYEADWFRKNSITYKCYFAIMGESGKRVTPTHTFLTFKDKEGKVYWFESSWGGNQGVREYKGEKELLDDFIDRFTKRRSKWQEVDIYEYRPSGTFVNLNSMDFINKITTENKMIKQIFNKNNPVKESVVSEALSRNDLQTKFLEKGDICYNLNNWSKNGYNILFVTGISGSGKTTLSTDLAKEFNANRIELDYISLYYMRKTYELGKTEKFYNKIRSECPEALEFLDNNPVENYGFRDKFADTLDICVNFCYWFVNKYENTNQLFIINGAQIMAVYDYKFFKNRPIILKDINIIKTILRRSYREFDTNNIIHSIENMYKAFKKGLSKDYIDANKQFKAYRSNLNNVAFREGCSDDKKGGNPNG